MGEVGRFGWEHVIRQQLTLCGKSDGMANITYHTKYIEITVPCFFSLLSLLPLSIFRNFVVILICLRYFDELANNRAAIGISVSEIYFVIFSAFLSSRFFPWSFLIAANIVYHCKIKFTPTLYATCHNTQNHNTHAILPNAKIIMPLGIMTLGIVSWHQPTINIIYWCLNKQIPNVHLQIETVR